MQEKDQYYQSFPKEKYGINHFSIGILTPMSKYIYQKKEKEIYDLASITKLFTLNIIYNLEKKHKIKWEDTIDKYLDFPNLKDYTIIDIIKMKGKIETEGKLSDAKDEKEFEKILKTVSIKSKESGLYTDIGFCILGILIEKVTQKSLSENFSELFQSLQLKNTKVLPSREYHLLGNGNKQYLPHDAKTRIYHGITGAAGVFSNVEDLIQYGLKIMQYQVFDQSFIEEIYNYQFIDIKNRNRSYAGLYKYTKDNRCYIEKEYSSHSLAHQGFTGPVLVIDFDNQIVNVLLFDAIQDGEKEKQDNFFEGYYLLQEKTAYFTLKEVKK